MAAKTVARLDGWKAIANYLGRDVRTAQRWRHERGMPIHRVPGGKRGSVFAERIEIEAWLHQAVLTDRAPAAAAAHENGAPSHGARAANPPPVTIPVAGVFSRRGSIAATALAAFAVGSIVVAGARMVKTTAARLVARVELDGNTLTAHAADATVLWRYLVRHTGPQLVLHGIGRVDWQGRGDADVLAFIDGTAPTDTSLLAGLGIYCFSSAGRLKWRYQPRGEITFSNRVFSG